MSRKQYPQLGGGPKHKPPAGQQCENCGDVATGLVWIEYSFMRGDDEATWVCDACNKRAHANIGKFVSSCWRRAKMLAAMKQEGAKA